MNKLEASVYAQNKANEEGKKLYDLLVPIFRPLVGTKILKNSSYGNWFTKKVEEMLPHFPKEGPVRIQVSSYRTYSLSWEVSVSAPYTYEEYCRYEDRMETKEGTLTRTCHVYIGMMENYVLKEISEFNVENNRMDYTVEEVLKAREVFKEAEQIYNETKSNLGIWGEFDRD